MKTTNGGVNWDIQNTNVTRVLNSIYFIDINTGFACGEFNSLIKTTNGGNNWAVLFDSILTTTLYSVFFNDNNTGFIAGFPNALKTTNSGLNWEILPLSESYYRDIYFTNANTGWICGFNGSISYTSTGGNTWIPQVSNTTEELYSISFINQNTGWITGNYYPLVGDPTNVVLKTTNAGTNWMSICNTTNKTMNQIDFKDENTGYGCGQINSSDSIYAIVQKTTDGGYNWTPKIIFNKNYLYLNSIQISGNTIWTAGNNIFKSNNEGNDWLRVTEGFYEVNQGLVVFPGINSLYISGTNGFFAKSTNGGSNWTEYPVLNSENLVGMYFHNPITGWAASFGGVYKTTNSGTNWILSIVPDQQFIKPFFINENTGWITSYRPNSVFKTTNGGLNWFNLTSISVSLAWGIHFFNENTGFVGDAFGGIYKTTNGGENWNTYNTGTYNWIADFYFFDENTGYAAGELHSIFKTTNAGENWNQIYTRDYGSFYDIEFIREGNNPPTKGYAVGSYMALYRTSDGGNNWYPMVSPTSNSMFEVKFMNSYTGFIIGSNGTLLYTTNGGSTFVYNVSNSVPDKYVLHQNYPNPFNNSTVVQFDIPKFSNVKIKLYNILGKEMETLVNDFYQAGTYKITVWTGDYPSGIYFYRFEAEGISETKKMLLVK